MKTPLVVMFLDAAARHAFNAKNHQNLDVREFEREHMEYAFQNALSCRNLSIRHRNEVQVIRQKYRDELKGIV